MSRHAVDRGHEQFLAAMRDGDAGALVALVSDDVTFCPPHEATRTGKSDVRAWAQQVFSQVKTQRIAVSDRDVDVSGDLAVDRGSFVWVVTPSGGGNSIEERGRFVAIWKKQSDGSWRVAHDIWNSSNPGPTV